MGGCESVRRRRRGGRRDEVVDWGTAAIFWWHISVRHTSFLKSQGPNTTKSPSLLPHFYELSSRHNKEH